MSEETNSNDPNMTVYSLARLKPPSLKGGPSDRLSHALHKLYEGLLSKKVEPICCAYQVVSEVCRALSASDIVGLVDRELGTTAKKMVVSAYSHRHCFMCKGGTNECDQCEGAGQEAPGRPCFRCEGLGLIICDFCHATDWADRQTIPVDLKSSVLDRHLVHVKTDLQLIQTTFAQESLDSLKGKPKSEKIKFITSLVRIQAQMNDLLKTDLGGDPQISEKFNKLIQSVSDWLNMFRVQPQKK
ncbi:MAG: hypothetical protein HZA50_09295 [Planctomycetes bacterium]|nr:hypothetical protein [Planctomycetota bacterium]